MSSKFSTCSKWLRGRSFTTEALRNGEAYSQNQIVGEACCRWSPSNCNPNRLKQMNSTFVSPCLSVSVVKSLLTSDDHFQSVPRHLELHWSLADELAVGIDVERMLGFDLHARCLPIFNFF